MLVLCYCCCCCCHFRCCYCCCDDDDDDGGGCVDDDDDSIDHGSMSIHLLAVALLVYVTTYLDRLYQDLNHYPDLDPSPFHHLRKCQSMNDRDCLQIANKTKHIIEFNQFNHFKIVFVCYHFCCRLLRLSICPCYDVVHS